MDVEELSANYTSCYTRWNFNPPASPHTGGVWERLIGTVKSCLDEFKPPTTPTDDVFRSWLLEAMNIVNSKPLIFIPLDTRKSEALTPKHFLLGSSNGLKPPGNFDADGPELRKKSKEIQRCTNIFWRRFVYEYVPTLTRRTKWFKEVKPLEVGDLVIDIDENQPRNTYRKAVIIETIKGSNDQVRRVKVRFANGNILWRPPKRLAVLDVAPTKVERLDLPKQLETGGNNVGATFFKSKPSKQNLFIKPTLSRSIRRRKRQM